ncbi:nuclear transport factor 2 family protein [Tsukamurella sp. NPDC003166]|uniref:nuclear transport factor 2 family protein n=1 Tax=Tsukamurella sp. NPDC003166 TaxID=3154444 RepID=UPI0033AC5DF0
MMFRTVSRRPALAVVTVAAAIALAGCGSSSNGVGPTSSGGASVAAVSSVSPAAGRFQMDPVAEAFVDAWNDRDATSMVNLFPADGVLVDDTRTFRGHQEIRSFAEPEVTGYTIKVLSVEERRADGQKILVEVNRNSGGGFRASFDFTIADGRIPRANLQYA